MSKFTGVHASRCKYAKHTLVKLRLIVWSQSDLHPGLQGVDRGTDAVFMLLQQQGVFKGPQDKAQALF